MSLEITIDAQKPSALAEFWAAAVPHYRVRPYDDDEITRLASLGLTPETDTSVPIEAEGQPTVWFQKSDNVTTSRNRLHFDLRFRDRNAEAERLKQLGAIIHTTRKDHIVMLDPEGNQFCLYDPRPDSPV